MDLLVLVAVGAVVIVLVLVGLARLHPGSGADLLDWGPARSYEHEVELEMQDVDQMIEAQNAYRRKRGAPELTEDEVRESIAREEVRKLSDDE